MEKKPAPEPAPGALPEPTGEMLQALYEELRALARSRLRREGRPQTLRTTELVHEAYLRLQTAQPHAWNNRGHFFAAAAEAMRRILIERARARGRAKRGGDEKGRPPQRLLLANVAAADLIIDYDVEDIVAMDAALERLSRSDLRAASVVRLRFYGGFSTAETAEALGVTDRTVRRDWIFARAWLFNALGG